MKSVVLFTRYFPFSFNSEEFILQELETVHNNYEITIVPFSRVGEECRGIPKGIKVNTALCDMNKFEVFIVLLEMFFSKYFWKSILSRDFFKTCKLLSEKLYYVKILFGAQSVKHIVKNNRIKYNSTTVFYSYWLTFAPLGLAYLKAEGVINNKVVARTHGYEIYEKGDVNPNSYPHFPMRDYTYKWIDNVYSISQKGIDILRKNYISYSDKYKISHLGVSSFMSNINKKQENIINVLSCSYLYPLKRVPLIFKSLYEYSKVDLDIKIKWYHIGTSRDDNNRGLELLKSMIKQTDNFEIHLLGQMPNADVLKFYKNHHLDVFINLSTTEGIPVSIMEALSAGLAIVATDVGSNNEIVTANVGRLLDVNFSQNDFNEALSDVIYNLEMMSAEAINEYNKHWNTYINYTDFYEEITK